ncbi:MAG TPA: hypothetical protein VJL29_06105 [Thermoguttaceae bacterium]|nr:hypothetical protein [Thermoguttaceae bacterium]
MFKRGMVALSTLLLGMAIGCDSGGGAKVTAPDKIPPPPPGGLSPSGGGASLVPATTPAAPANQPGGDTP